VPSAHATFGAVLPAQYVPTSHAVHCAGEVGVAGAVCTVPAAHAPSGTHDAWFGDDEYVPSAHGAHARSDEGVPGELTYVPGAHVVHGVQLGAFSVALKLPVGHAAHVRSVVLLGVFVTYVPAGHVDHSTHAVSGSPSWSHAPGAHPLGSTRSSPPASATAPPSCCTGEASSLASTPGTSGLPVASTGGLVLHPVTSGISAKADANDTAENIACAPPMRLTSDRGWSTWDRAHTCPGRDIPRVREQNARSAALAVEPQSRAGRPPRCARGGSDSQQPATCRLRRIERRGEETGAALAPATTGVLPDVHDGEERRGASAVAFKPSNASRPTGEANGTSAVPSSTSEPVRSSRDLGRVPRK